MRYLLMILLIVALVILIAITVQLIKSGSSRRLYKTLRKIFDEMEREYENYVNSRLSMEILNKNNLDFDQQKLIDEVRTILQPYLESLWALANSSHIADNVDLKLDTKYFKNLYFLTDKFLKQKLPLTSFEKEEMTNAMLDAVRADLSKRALQLKSGF